MISPVIFIDEIVIGEQQNQYDLTVGHFFGNPKVLSSYNA